MRTVGCDTDKRRSTQISGSQRLCPSWLSLLMLSAIIYQRRRDMGGWALSGHLHAVPVKSSSRWPVFKHKSFRRASSCMLHINGHGTTQTHQSINPSAPAQGNNISFNRCFTHVLRTCTWMVSALQPKGRVTTGHRCKSFNLASIQPGERFAVQCM